MINLGRQLDLYMDLMQLQHQIPIAVQSNYFEMQLDVWRRMLPYYSSFNTVNYARYGSRYVNEMKQIDNCSWYVNEMKQIDNCSQSSIHPTTVKVSTAYNNRPKK